MKEEITKGNLFISYIRRILIFSIYLEKRKEQLVMIIITWNLEGVMKEKVKIRKN